MFPLLPLLFVDVTTILLIVEPDGTDVLLIVKEPRAEVATVSFVGHADIFLDRYAYTPSII